METNDEKSCKVESFPVLGLQLKVPHPLAVKEKYRAAQQSGKPMDFPYWTRIWPSAVALSEYILENKEMFQNQRVLELGAGIGLPSFVAARYASSVIVSDYLPEIKEWLDLNIGCLGIKNMESRQLDWRQLSTDINADLVLLSDLNYEPAQFPALRELINRFLESGASILISSPHRLAGRSFLSEWMKRCKYHDIRETQNSPDVQPPSEKITILHLKD